MMDGSVATPAVLVRCFKDVSRSASIVTAYSIRETAVTYEQALLIVKKRKICIWPTAGFVEPRDYDVHLRDGRDMAMETKFLYDEARVRWEIVKKSSTE